MSSLLTIDLGKDCGLTTSLRSSAMVCLLGVNLKELIELLILTSSSELLDLTSMGNFIFLTFRIFFGFFLYSGWSSPPTSRGIVFYSRFFAMPLIV